MILTRPSSTLWPNATDAERSGSKSTSDQLTELVVNAAAPVASALSSSPVSSSLMEYPNYLLRKDHH